MPALIPIPVTPKIMWRIAVDFMGPFPMSRNGNVYAGIAQCAFTKFIEAARN
jgi:hypothetical protein